MWTGTFGLRADLASRLAATAAVGYRSMSVSPLDVVADPSAALAMAQATGVALTFVDPVLGWCGPLTPGASELTRFPVEEVLDAAAAVGAEVVNAIALADHDPSRAEIVDGFGRLCAQAAERDLVVQLEFVPMSLVAGLRDAATIVGAVAAPGAGLCVDSWHFFRGASQLDDVANLDVPVLSVQLSDAPAAASGPPWRETIEGRLLPGQGELPLHGLLVALGAVGALERIGPEVISTRMRSLPPGQVARLAATATERMLEAAEAETLSIDKIFPRLLP